MIIDKKDKIIEKEEMVIVECQEMEKSGSQIWLAKDCFSLDILLVSKISKRHFIRGILNSCQLVTQMGLEPHQKSFLKKFQKLKPLAPF